MVKIGDESVLEIGTGAGLVAARLLRKFPRLTYISFEPNRHLRAYLEEHIPDRIQSFIPSGKDLRQIPDSSMDIVIASGVYTYLESATILSYFRETARVLRPNGLAIFDIFDSDDSSDWIVSSAHNFANQGDSRPFLSQSFVARFAQTIGLILEKTWKWKHASGSTYLVFRRK